MGHPSLSGFRYVQSDATGSHRLEAKVPNTTLASLANRRPAIRSGRLSCSALRVAHLTEQNASNQANTDLTQQAQRPDSMGARGLGGHLGQNSVIWGTKGPEFKFRQPDYT